jgi:anti-sigma-K factor RskA
MNLTQNPELLDRLAASYSLGTLHGGARRRFEQLAREYPQVRAAALLWQGRWSAFSEVQTPVQPDAVVWTRIANLLQAETAKAKLARQREACIEVGMADTRMVAWTGTGRRFGHGGGYLGGALVASRAQGYLAAETVCATDSTPDGAG